MRRVLMIFPLAFAAILALLERAMTVGNDCGICSSRSSLGKFNLQLRLGRMSRDRRR